MTTSTGWGRRGHRLLDAQPHVQLRVAAATNMTCQTNSNTNGPTDFAQHIADEAVTLVRDNGRIFPKTEAWAGSDVTRGGDSQTKPDLVAIVLGEALESTNGREFEKALRSRRPGAQIFYLTTAPSKITS